MFENKVALISGSGRGIGATIALNFASLGADVVVNFFRNREPAENTAQKIRMLGRKALVVKANMGELDDVDRLFQAVEHEFGGLDIYVHNAASGYNRPVMEQRPKGWDWTMNINARSLLFAAQYAAPLMEKRGGGSIVAISSPGASRVLPDYVVVGASKAAIEAITRYLAVELAPRNIVMLTSCQHDPRTGHRRGRWCQPDCTRNRQSLICDKSSWDISEGPVDYDIGVTFQFSQVASKLIIGAQG
jgi:enoyl-[acyl-carrier protein] reductase III